MTRHSARLGRFDGHLPLRGPPTDRQLEVLSAIAELTIERRCPPTMREVGDRLGFRSTNAVATHYVALYRRGYIEHERLASRGITLTLKGLIAVGAVCPHYAGSGMWLPDVPTPVKGAT